MYPALLGRKIGMTRIYDDEGRQVPVTVVQAGPCDVTQVKTIDTADGYFAVQLGFEDAKAKHSTFPVIGHDAKAGVSPKRVHREVRLKDASDKAVGETIDVSVFEGVTEVDVVGTSKGKGTQGVMKRYNFGGQPATHGTERKHRSPGSIGGRATNRGFNGRPKKGLRMAGRMGNERVTTKNHKVVKVDAENGLLLIKGPLPGANGGLLEIHQSLAERSKKSEAA
ncbi:MAG: 50S ribosomal protein L3 [Planctomycetota bacterium]